MVKNSNYSDDLCLLVISEMVITIVRLQIVMCVINRSCKTTTYNVSCNDITSNHYYRTHY